MVREYMNMDEVAAIAGERGRPKPGVADLRADL